MKLGEINEFAEIENGSRDPNRDSIKKIIDNYQKQLKQN